MVYLSKSKFCNFCDCPKKEWLNRYKPEEYKVTEADLERMNQGNIVGDLAMQYFGEFVEVTAYDGDKLDLKKMIENTNAEMEKGTQVICEASFSYNGLYCAVDILKRENDGWAIYEVKSSTKKRRPDKNGVVPKEDEHKMFRYINDITYQKYVLEHCGVNVTGTYLMRLDNSYVFDGELDLSKLFYIDDVSERVAKKMPEIETDLTNADKILSNDKEPEIGLGKQCNKPGECEFWDYCTANLTKPNVFDLYGTGVYMSKKLKLYDKGLIDFASLENEKTIVNEIAKRQIEYYLHDKGDYINKEEIKNFLDTLTFPLYFFDFESVQPNVPKYVGTYPYTQIPFQYSLHYIESENGELKHTEFLEEAGKDPLRNIAEAICRDIPTNGCVLVFNDVFERTRLTELAGYFPDLADHLLKVRDNIKDLLDPFRNGWYYNKEMGGSFSIKSVLPALYPNEPSLDYHNLEGIHNGGEAMNAFTAMENMSPEEVAETRKNLLKYCCLDTYALVKVWEKLKEAVE